MNKRRDKTIAVAVVVVVVVAASVVLVILCWCSQSFSIDKKHLSCPSHDYFCGCVLALTLPNFDEM